MIAKQHINISHDLLLCISVSFRENSLLSFDHSSFVLISTWKSTCSMIQEVYLELFLRNYPCFYLDVLFLNKYLDNCEAQAKGRVKGKDLNFA